LAHHQEQVGVEGLSIEHKIVVSEELDHFSESGGLPVGHDVFVNAIDDSDECAKHGDLEHEGRQYEEAPDVGAVLTVEILKRLVLTDRHEVHGVEDVQRSKSEVIANERAIYPVDSQEVQRGAESHHQDGKEQGEGKHAGDRLLDQSHEVSRKAEEAHPEEPSE